VINIKTTVVGSAELRERFLRVGDEVRNRIRKTMLALAREVSDQAASAAPRGKSGKLAASLKKVKLSETDTRMSVQVGPPRFYGKFLEFGVVGHGTASNKSRAGSAFAQVKRVRELRASGQWRIAPRPFMGPAIDRVRTKVDDALNAAMAQAVSKS
jgi:HK97 gp10 family phage protein